MASVSRNVVAIAFAMVAVLFVGSTSARAQDKLDTTKGKLLIIGGGMTAAMASQVYGLLADQLPEGGVVGYLPTASEATTDEKEMTDGRLAKSLKGRTLKLINITGNDAAKANDPELAKQIEACDAIFFGGGAQSRIVKVFKPDGKPTLISKAVDAVLAKGGTVAGTSAGAEIMSDPMILMGESDKALADPKSLPIGRGMGYFPFGMVDQHFLQRGRFGRLVVALERTNQHFGFGISEARALLVDRAAAKMTAVGPDAVVFIDRSKADGRKNWRVSLLSDGDTMNGKTGAVTLSPDRTAAKDGASKPATQQPASVPSAGSEPWKKKMLVGDLLHAVTIGAPATLVDPSQTFTFAADGMTAVRYSSKPTLSSILNVRLDITPTGE